jgi:hypothetical protein
MTIALKLLILRKIISMHFASFESEFSYAFGLRIHILKKDKNTIILKNKSHARQFEPILEFERIREASGY